MPGPVRAALLWGFVFGFLGFAAGFAFGALRELVLIPALGEGRGRLAEFPAVTLTVCAIGAVIGARSAGPAITIGLLGAGFLIALESTMALALMRVSLADYLAGYDITRGALFPIGLAVMALSPAFGRWLKRR